MSETLATILSKRNVKPIDRYKLNHVYYEPENVVYNLITISISSYFNIKIYYTKINDDINDIYELLSENFVNANYDKIIERINNIYSKIDKCSYVAIKKLYNIDVLQSKTNLIFIQLLSEFASIFKEYRYIIMYSSILLSTILNKYLNYLQSTNNTKQIAITLGYLLNQYNSYDICHSYFLDLIITLMYRQFIEPNKSTILMELETLYGKKFYTYLLSFSDNIIGSIKELHSLENINIKLTRTIFIKYTRFVYNQQLIKINDKNKYISDLISLINESTSLIDVFTVVYIARQRELYVISMYKFSVYIDGSKELSLIDNIENRDYIKILQKKKLY